MAISTVYQIFKISERVVKKQSGKMKASGMKVLSEFIGISKKLREQKYMMKLVFFLVARHRKK